MKPVILSGKVVSEMGPYKVLFLGIYVQLFPIVEILGFMSCNVNINIILAHFIKFILLSFIIIIQCFTLVTLFIRRFHSQNTCVATAFPVFERNKRRRKIRLGVLQMGGGVYINHLKP